MRSAHVQQFLGWDVPERLDLSRIVMRVFGAIATPSARNMPCVAVLPMQPGTANGGADTPRRVLPRRGPGCTGMPQRRPRARVADHRHRVRS